MSGAELLIIGAAVSAVGAVQQGIAASNASKYNAKIAEQNAKVIREQTSEQMRMRRVQARKETGAAVAAYGASGVSLQGSPLDAIEESIFNAEMDVFNIQYQGRLDEISQLNQAKLYRYQAKSERIGGFMTGAATLATGLGKSGYFSSSPESTNLNYGDT